MEATATFKYLRVAPRKLRLIVDQVRGKNVQKALDLLKFDRKTAARDVSKLLRSAVANADQKGGIKLEALYVKDIQVNQAPILKRWLPRARGSASSIHKKMSHMKVVLGERI